MNTQKFFIIAISFLLSLSLLGCGGKSPQTGNDAEGETTTEEEKPLTYEDLFDLNLACVPYLNSKENLLQNTLCTVQNYLDDPSISVKTHDLTTQDKAHLFLVEMTASDLVNQDDLPWAQDDCFRIKGEYRYSKETAISKFNFKVYNINNYSDKVLEKSSFFCDPALSATHLRYISIMVAEPTSNGYEVKDFIGLDHYSFNTPSYNIKVDDDDETDFELSDFTPSCKLIVAYEVCTVTTTDGYHIDKVVGVSGEPIVESSEEEEKQTETLISEGN